MRWWGWLVLGAALGGLGAWLVLAPVPQHYACVRPDGTVVCGQKAYPP